MSSSSSAPDADSGRGEVIAERGVSQKPHMLYDAPKPATQSTPKSQIIIVLFFLYESDLLNKKNTETE